MLLFAGKYRAGRVMVQRSPRSQKKSPKSNKYVLEQSDFEGVATGAPAEETDTATEEILSAEVAIEKPESTEVVEPSECSKQPEQDTALKRDESLVDELKRLASESQTAGDVAEEASETLVSEPCKRCGCGAHNDSAVPHGCVDYHMENDALVEMPPGENGDWRCTAGVEIGYGFELTHDKCHAQSHLLCRLPLHEVEDIFCASLEYVMEPVEHVVLPQVELIKAGLRGAMLKGVGDEAQTPNATNSSGSVSAGESHADEESNDSTDTGCAVCLYLLDPSVGGWDTEFDGAMAGGFVGKRGALVAVVIDLTGEFSEGHADSVVVRRACDNELLCQPVQLEGGVLTTCVEDHWREVDVEFDVVTNTCVVRVGGAVMLDCVKLDGVQIPRCVSVGVSVCRANKACGCICVNSVEIENRRMKME